MAAISLQVSGRCVRAVVHCQQIFRHRRQARDEEEHQRSRKRQRAKRERVVSRQRYVVDVIGWLKKRHGAGKNVWLAVDKRLRADKEGADAEAMADILRGCKAQQLARKLGCLGDEKVILASIEIGDRIRMRLQNGIKECSTAGDKEQTRRCMETALEEMIEKYGMTTDKEQVKLRIVQWMEEALEKEFGKIGGPSEPQ